MRNGNPSQISRKKFTQMDFHFHKPNINISFETIKMTDSFLTKYRPSAICNKRFQIKINDYMEKALYSFIQMDELNI